MAIDFPSNPSAGQTYSYGGQSWEYTGVVWNKLAATSSNVVTSINGATGAITNVAFTNVDNVFSSEQSVSDSGSGWSTVVNGNYLEFNTLDAFDNPYTTTFYASTFGSPTITLPATTTTLAGIEIPQTFTGLQSFTTGVSASGATFQTIQLKDIRIHTGLSTIVSSRSFGIGNNTLLSCNGSNNIGIGNDAAKLLTSSNSCIAIGSGALSGATAFASTNVALGGSSLQELTSGTVNVGLGPSSLATLRTGDNNTAVGYYAGYLATNTVSGVTFSSGSNNTFIGSESRAFAATGSNQIVIGADAVGFGNNTAVLGATGQVAAYIYGVVNAIGGLSAAGATFSSLVRFNAGISAAGATLSANTIIPSGSTLTVNGNFVANGNVNLGDATTDSITVAGLLRANSGISAAGATFSGNITIPANGSINSNNGILYIGDNTTMTTRVTIGDVNQSANATYIYMWDSTSLLDIINPYGAVRIGDPDGINSNVYINLDNTTGAAEIVAGGISLVGSVTISNGLLNPLSGISAAGGVTFGGTVASDTGYRITSNAINAQTGTTYTFLESDNGKVVTFNNGSAITVTIPTGLPVGFNCTGIQLGAGQVGFTAASGVTLQSYGNQYKLIGQHASATIIEYSNNIVNLSGNLIV